MTVVRAHAFDVALALVEIGMFAAVWGRLPQQQEISLCPAAGARRDLAGGQMPAMGHTLKNVRRWRSVLHMPQTWAFAAGKSSHENCIDNSVKADQVAPRFTRATSTHRSDPSKKR